MNTDGLRNLKEPDQPESIQTLSPGLVAVHPRKSCVDGRVGRNQAVDVANRKEPANGVQRRATDESN
jgi:hypothetical protein